MFWKGSSRLVEVLKACFESWKDSSQLVEVQQQLFEYLEGSSRQVEVCQQQFMEWWALIRFRTIIVHFLPLFHTCICTQRNIQHTLHVLHPHWVQMMNTRVVAILVASLLLDTHDGFEFTIFSGENKQSINLSAALAASGCSLAVANFNESTLPPPYVSPKHSSKVRYNLGKSHVLNFIWNSHIYWVSPVSYWQTPSLTLLFCYIALRSWWKLKWGITLQTFDFSIMFYYWVCVLCRRSKISVHIQSARFSLGRWLGKFTNTCSSIYM